MKLISFVYDEGFNLLFQFPVFIKPCTQMPLTLYQLETVHASIKVNNTETNSYTLLQPMKDNLGMIEENDITFIIMELSAYKHIGHKYFSETIVLENRRHHRAVNQ